MNKGYICIEVETDLEFGELIKDIEKLLPNLRKTDVLAVEGRLALTEDEDEEAE